jgi:hypothetical protein
MQVVVAAYRQAAESSPYLQYCMIGCCPGSLKVQLCLCSSCSHVAMLLLPPLLLLLLLLLLPPPLPPPPLLVLLQL